MKRRSFFAMGGGVLAGSLLWKPSLGAPQSSGSSSTVETSAGRIRGRVRDAVHIFQGVRYGAAPVGTRRFMPPERPETWTGVQDALDYGPRAYQPFRR